MLGLAVTLALATALVELAVHFVRRKFINPSSLGALQLNPQAYWMVPVSDVLIFGGCGLLVAAAAVLCRSRRAAAAGVFGLFFVSAFAVLLTFRGSDASRLFVFRRRPCLPAHGSAPGPAGRPARLVRRGLPALLASWPSSLASVPAAKSSTSATWFTRLRGRRTSCSLCSTQCVPRA